VAEISKESLVNDAVVEAIDDVLLRDIDDGGTCVEEVASVGSQELVTFLFALRQIVMSTCSSNRPLKVVGEDSLQIIPRVDGVFLMRTCLLCIQCKDRLLEHVRDSWISKYILTLSIIFSELILGSMHVLLIRNNEENKQGLGERQGVKEEELGHPHQGGVHVQLDFDSTSGSRT
jgi:hypothetical protein